MRNILVLKGDSSEYDALFVPWGKVTHNIDELEDCDLVVFTGGTDVDPALYGEVPLPTTQVADTTRDKLEHAVYVRALLLQLPMVGICRGAQFLNVMNNGSLHQHIEKHTACDHVVRDFKGDSLMVKGDHHQAMRPEGEHVILSTSTDGIAEEVFWPISRCLAVQWHPEWHKSDDLAAIYFQKLLEQYVM